MVLYSAPQLIAANMFEIPLPSRADIWCRECGGPINKEQAVIKKYPKTWVDEGLITFPMSKHVCPACIELAKGSTTRSITLPPAGTVMIISSSINHPGRGQWLRAYSGDRLVKKEEIYPEPISLIDFLENILPDLKPPFGIVFSETGSNNQKHYLRYVPLNYNNHIVTMFIMPGFTYAEIRVAKFLEAYYGIREIIDLSPKKMREAFQEKAKEYKLGITEARLLYRYLYTEKYAERNDKNKTKEEDNNE